MFSFEKSFLCCGCKIRFKMDEVKLIYKRSCICNNCYDEFDPYTENACFDAIDGVEFLAPVFRYKDAYRRIFLDFKFNSYTACGHLLGQAIAEVVKGRDFFEGYSYIVPVPVSKHRYSERGYNQSGILAKYVSGALDIPIKKVIRRTGHSIPQSRLSMSKRSENVKDVFSVNAQLSGENVILFDDVYRTGSTACECAKVLREAGAGKVCVIAAAYNQPVPRPHTLI